MVSMRFPLMLFKVNEIEDADKEEDAESRVPDDEVESYDQMFSRQ